MPSDDDDTPKGALIALSLGVCILLFIVISTFQSCTNLEGDRIRNYCSQIRFSIEPALRESAICLTSDGKLNFGVVNTGDLNIEGFSIRTLGKSFNDTKKIKSLSTQQYSILLGPDVYQTMAPIEIIPLAFYPQLNETVACPAVKQTIKDINLCIQD